MKSQQILMVLLLLSLLNISLNHSSHRVAIAANKSQKGLYVLTCFGH